MRISHPKHVTVRFARQAGIVLPVAMLILVAVTILSLALVKANMISLRVGGASVIAAETQSKAELWLSSFFVQNPINQLTGQTYSADATYYLDNAPCSDDAHPGDRATIFDCRPHTTPAKLTVSRIGCGAPPPGSGDDTDVRHFYHQVRSVESNSQYGSQAQVNAGISVRTGRLDCMATDNHR